MERKQSWSLSYSLQGHGADIDDPRKVEIINIHWILTQKAINEFLPTTIKDLCKETPKQKADNFSGRMMTLEMASSQALSLYERTWLESAKSLGRENIHDIGVRLAPENGLPNVEGGKTLIQELKDASWKPVSFDILEKSATEQRIANKKEDLKKIFFKLSFKRTSSPEPEIEIPEPLMKVFAEQATFKYCHIWYNPVILHTINVNYTALWWNPDPKKRLPYKWVVTL